MPTPTAVVDLFKEKAEFVSAIVTKIESEEQAFDYATQICDQKEACQLLVSGCREPLSPPADDLCQSKQEKVIAAPGLNEKRAKALDQICAQKGIKLVTENLREHTAGIDIGFTFADYGIAETGTLVLDSSNEDIRLATMISEVHIAVLAVSAIRQSAFDLEHELAQFMHTTPNYTAFISGASRTADIERVLALGVHGPLELHILLQEGN